MKKELVLRIIIIILAILLFVFGAIIVIKNKKGIDEIEKGVQNSKIAEPYVANLERDKQVKCLNDLKGADAYAYVSKINDIDQDLHIDYFIYLLNYFLCEVNLKHAPGKLTEFYEAGKRIEFDNDRKNKMTEKELEWVRGRTKEMKYKCDGIEDDEEFSIAYINEEVEIRKRFVDDMYQFPTYSIIKGDINGICNGLEEVKYIQDDFLLLMEKHNNYTKDELGTLVGEYCDIFKKYEDDPALLVSEVYDFKDWSLNPDERLFQINWKTILAIRFGGYEKATTICYTLNDFDEREMCLDKMYWRSKLTKRYDEASEGCFEERQILVDSLCDPEPF